MLGVDVPATMKSQRSHNHHQFDPLTELVYLEQTGNVHDYFDSFKLLLARVEISEDLAIEVFLRGLEPEIQTSVRSFKPNDLYVAYSLARLKESTIRVLGVKEDVVDELGAMSELEYAKEGSENAGAFEVFDEMPVKDMIGVSDANMSIKVLPGPESVFQDRESQDEDLCLVEGELGGSCLGFLFQHDSLRNGGSSVNANRIMEALTAYPDEEIKGDNADCDLRNLYHSPNAQLKEGNQLAKGWNKYPSLHKGNLRLGVSST